MRFIFPSDYFNPKKVDEAYIEQVDCLRNMGFETSVISLEALASKDGRKRVVEVGDGQVSDLVGWTAERFASVRAEIDSK
jgi:hypothetical protein